MGAFERGPIGFKVFAFGWEDGIPFLIVLVATEEVKREIKLMRKNGKWWAQGEVEVILDQEEQEFATIMWDGERRKAGVPE